MLSQAATSNQLADKESITQVAKNCVNVDLATWKHPVRAALISHEFEIQKVQMCNDGKYPVFYGQPKADPRSSRTRAYFMPMYESVFKANGRWPYSLVYQRDHYAASIRADKGEQGLTVSEENYDDPIFIDSK